MSFIERREKRNKSSKMKFCTIFAVFIIIWTIVFNIAAEPIFFKHPGGILFPIKGSADKQQRDHTKHSKHRERRKHQSHRRHVTCITCMSVAEPITISPTPVTGISEPIIVAPPAVTEPNIIIPPVVKEPIIISPPAATEPIIVVPPVVTATSPTLTTASTATTTLFGPGKCQTFSIQDSIHIDK